MAYWSRFVPRDRLIMGLPAYSRDFALRLDGQVQSPEAPQPQVPEGTEVRRLWLPWEQISTYQYEDMEGVLHLFFATDETSTRAQLQTADELDLGGIGFWHFGAVTPEMWAAVRQWLAETP
jgi:spore germination protein YaaH